MSSRSATRAPCSAHRGSRRCRASKPQARHGGGAAAANLFKGHFGTRDVIKVLAQPCRTSQHVECCALGGGKSHGCNHGSLGVQGFSACTCASSSMLCWDSEGCASFVRQCKVSVQVGNEFAGF
jgi:hypothetical protein